MKRFVLTLIISFITYCIGYAEEPVKVACIGNSITYGLKVKDRETNCYPAKLQSMLGEGYEVGNFGHSGATLLSKGHRPYILTEEWAAAKEFTPDIAVIHLGTNDTDPRNWPNYGDEFVGDYLALIDTLRMINPNVRILVANMCPIGAAHARFKTGTRVWRDSIRDRIADVARIANAELIDFDTPLKDFPNLFPDAVHPNSKGAAKLADYVYNALTGKYGLSLPEVWQSGMVVPWGKKFTITGKAEAGKTVKVRIKDKTYTGIADNLGRWSAEIDPLPAGGNFSIDIYDGDTLLTLSDVTAGEVWLASGQSNMAFMLSQAKDTPEEIAPDSLVRFFDMFPIAYTDNKDEWDEDTKEKISDLKHYRKGKWGMPTKYTSAVAWNFARTLADSLRRVYGHDIPVGVISNAVGGSPTESWIDIETLKHSEPDALVDWKHNDWVQPWVQQRAEENSGSDDSRVRHPYEPGYLFASGIRPLASFPISGVIWYQGESNAHNVELHETYFRTLVDDWRREFGNPELPFIFAQLSSINRPSWPAFRDSQRRLAESIDNTYMAVTSDLGHKTDVHPKRKAPVGRRMALQALANVYGWNGIAHEGPLPVRMTPTADGGLYIHMKNAEGLTASDTLAIHGFEIAENEGLYFEAEIEVRPDGVVLRHPEMKKPRLARYAWRPYTDANMINKDSLPTSTFKIEADNIDAGIEYGVSGAFAGVLPDGRVIIAGGCNFPFEDPISVPASAKRFYSGIYDAETGERLGMLPKPTAYGASVTTRRGVAMIGGQDNKECWLFDGERITTLPELPQPVDNGYAAAINDDIYLLGGYYLYRLQPGDKEWKPIERIPGDPRVQPVMASSGNYLYIWGGFTPSIKGKAPQVHDDGLMYDPATKKWTRLTAVTADGKPLTLSGGVAVTTPNGEIVATGGVNHKIFLDAITSQAPDYLQHDAEWYNFNPYVMKFNPKDKKWTVVKKDAKAARAGASAVWKDDSLILMGGELKPRVRTTEMVRF